MGVPSASNSPSALSVRAGLSALNWKLSFRLKKIAKGHLLLVKRCILSPSFLRTQFVMSTPGDSRVQTLGSLQSLSLKQKLDSVKEHLIVNCVHNFYFFKIDFSAARRKYLLQRLHWRDENPKIWPIQRSQFVGQVFNSVPAAPLKSTMDSQTNRQQNMELRLSTCGFIAKITQIADVTL